MLIKKDFYRKVWCLLGLPFDAIIIDDAVNEVRLAAEDRIPCFISTPNLNFIIAAQNDINFRDSVIISEMSIPDGMPIIWIARFLGYPLYQRVSGAGLFEELNKSHKKNNKIKVLFFGGMNGVAKRACESLNIKDGNLHCVGHIFPGFGDISEMSGNNILKAINDSLADFVIVSLGAKKGQHWIIKNRDKLTAPIISHLGAVVNFVAGEVKRAPKWMQNSGLEWLWRIFEEPILFRRYAIDGLNLIKLILTKVIPYKILLLSNGIKPNDKDIQIEISEMNNSIEILPRGKITAYNLNPMRDVFFNAVCIKKNIKLNLKYVEYIDASFIGLIMILYKYTILHDCELHINSASKQLKRIFYYNNASFLLQNNY